jgi:hypothetical protein
VQHLYAYSSFIISKSPLIRHGALYFVWAVFTILTGLVICHPLSMFWDLTSPGGHCGNLTAAFSAGGVFDVLTDLFIFLLPIPMVWQLQVPRANKFALACIFALGIWYAPPALFSLSIDSIS